MNKSVLFFASITFLLLAPVVEAQYLAAGANVYAGGGAFFGQNNCSGAPSLPPAILDKNNDVQDINRDITDIKRSIRDAKENLRMASQGFNKDDSVVCSWFRHGGDYDVCGALRKWFKNATNKTADLKCMGADFKNPHPWKAYCADKGPNPSRTDSLEAGDARNEWTNLNASNGSDNFPDPQQFCQTDGLITKYAQAHKLEANSDKTNSYNDSCPACSKYLASGDGKYTEADCEEALKNYETDWQSYSQAQTQLNNAQLSLKIAQRDLEDARHRRSRAVDRYAQDVADGNVSAQICWRCFNGNASQGPSTLDKILPLVGSVLGMGVTYATVHYTDQQNAKLGWPSNPWMGYEMAYPFAMAGIYGAMNAGGCSMGGPGGAFGYPSGYYSPFGGGMSPYMMNPYMMNPMMGPGGMGMAPFMGVGGMGMAPYMGMGGMMPYSGMMPGMMGMPGMIGIGIGGAIAGGMSPFGYMSPGWGAMTPSMGMMAPGMMGGAMMGMMSPYGAMSPYGMMNPYASMGMPGMMGIPGMMGMPGAMNPYASMSPMMNSGYMTAMMQYQQQMMAIQMQQMQDYQNRQMLVGQLSQQLMQIQVQIQQIEMGGGISGFGGLTTGISPFGGTPGFGTSGFGTPGFGTPGFGTYPTGYTTSPYGTVPGTTAPYTGPARGQGYGVPTAF